MAVTKSEAMAQLVKVFDDPDTKLVAMDSHRECVDVSTSTMRGNCSRIQSPEFEIRLRLVNTTPTTGQRIAREHKNAFHIDDIRLAKMIDDAIKSAVESERKRHPEPIELPDELD